MYQVPRASIPRLNTTITTAPVMSSVVLRGILGSGTRYHSQMRAAKAISNTANSD